MKSKKYTILINLLVGLSVFQEAFPCSHPVYTPGEYYVFRAYEKKEDSDMLKTSHLNILEWQEYTANKAAYDDIKEVVYEFYWGNVEILGDESKTDSIKASKLYENTFVRYLTDNKDKDAIQLLTLAKECELARSIRTDKWWYPTKEDLRQTDLQDILERALAYNGQKLKTRYLLQAVRAAYTMEKYDLCLNLWNEEIQHQPESVVKNMCEDYIGGIYFQRNNFEKAIQHYAKNMQDLNSFWWCADKLTEINSDVERIKILYKYCPDSPELTHMIEKICREAEERINPKVFDNYVEEASNDDWWSNNYGYKSYLNNRNRYTELRDFALQVVSEKRAEDLALWQYTAAFLTMIDGNAKSAHQYIRQAERMKTTPFLQDNIRILRIMLEAFVGNYDAAFENRMLKELKWLDKKIVDNLSKEITKEYVDWEGTMFANYSMFYYNDMMRKITLSVMLPQYVKRGKEAKALLLAGMASERMRLLTDYRKKQTEKESPNTWNIDFYTDIFNVMDTLSVQGVVEYKQLLQKKKGNSFDRFLAEKCYINIDYLNEIIGTKYMRTADFDRAVAYLSIVKSGYEKTLNIREYFCFAPFFDASFGGKRIDIQSDYKLSYAMRMSDLQQIMNTAKSNETKAEAMHQYAIGLTQAMNDCWALLRYRKGSLYYYGDEKLNKWKPQLESVALKMIDNACEISDDKELKAKCIALILSLNRNNVCEYVYDKSAKDWKRTWNRQNPYIQYSNLLFKEYDKTDFYRRLFMECDTFSSYVTAN